MNESDLQGCVIEKCKWNPGWPQVFTLQYNGSADQVHLFTGQQALINRTASESGSGWWLSGLHRLHVTANEGALLENADGRTTNTTTKEIAFCEPASATAATGVAAI